MPYARNFKHCYQLRSLNPEILQIFSKHLQKRVKNAYFGIDILSTIICTFPKKIILLLRWIFRPNPNPKLSPSRVAVGEEHSPKSRSL